MSRPSFVYVTYIATTPEKVWAALVDSETTRLYWGGPATECSGLEHVSEVKPGSRWESRHRDAARTLAMVGKVLESTPPHRLVMTWARTHDADAVEKHSRVTFDIAPQGERLVRLTVIHEDLDADMSEVVSGGWPRVLANLKTLLETGQVLQPSLWR